MANRKARFTEADIVRAIKGFQAGGLTLGAIRIEPDGTIALIAKGYEDAFEEAEVDWRKGSVLYSPKPSEPNAYSVRTLADHWQCSTGLVRSMIARGELRSFRHGNLIRITPEAVAEVEARREGAANAEAPDPA